MWWQISLKERKPLSITLPYVQGLSERVKRVLQALGVQVRFRPNRMLCQILVKPKDPIPTSEWNGIMYRIPCKDCSKAYIGQSGRSLVCRIKEHRRAVQNGDVNSSAVAEHAWQRNHYFDWEAAGVIHSSSDWFLRCLIESWHIHREPDPMNRERGSLPQIRSTFLPKRKH